MEWERKVGLIYVVGGSNLGFLVWTGLTQSTSVLEVGSGSSRNGTGEGGGGAGSEGDMLGCWTIVPQIL